MGCYTCKYFSAEGKLCGVGLTVTEKTIGTSLCDKYVKGESIKFSGTIFSEWEYIANPNTLSQLPKKLKVICDQPVLHYSCKRKKRKRNSRVVWYVTHKFITKGPYFNRIAMQSIREQLFGYYGHNEEFKSVNLYAYYVNGFNELIYEEMLESKAAYSSKTKRKAKRKDKVRLDGRTNWYDEAVKIIEKKSSTLSNLSGITNPCREISAGGGLQNRVSNQYAVISPWVSTPPNIELQQGANLTLGINSPVYISRPQNGRSELRIGSVADTFAEGTIRITNEDVSVYTSNAEWRQVFSMVMQPLNHQMREDLNRAMEHYRFTGARIVQTPPEDRLINGIMLTSETPNLTQTFISRNNNEISYNGDDISF